MMTRNYCKHWNSIIEQSNLELASLNIAPADYGFVRTIK